MDLLFELIVWLMRSLFGDPEKPADPSKFPHQSNPSRRPQRGDVKRGPYVYGDEPVATGKSLEQILEEVRREAMQRRTGRAPEPEPEPVAVEAPEPRRRTLSENLEAADAARAEEAAETAAENLAGERRQGHGMGVDALPSEHPVHAARRQTPELKPAPAKAVQAESVGPSAIAAIESQQSGSASINAITERQSNVGLRVRGRDTEAARLAAGATGAPAGTSLQLLYALRHAPTGEKARVAREALVIIEVFGPPRARRQHKVGARTI